MKKIELTGLNRVLSNAGKVVILGHKNPDGDAIGSTMGLHLYLKQKNVNSHVIMPNDYPDFLKWLPGNDQVMIFERNKSECTDLLKEADLIFTLDFNDLSRVGDDMAKILENLDTDFGLIDHHRQPGDYATYQMTDDQKSSTSEMVYDFIDYFEETDLIDEAIATNLYAGILTDTGSFKYASTTAHTHRIIAHLIDHGAPNNLIHKNIFDVNSLNKLKLLGLALTQLKKVPKHEVAYIYLTRKNLEDHQFKKGDTEGFVNYALSIKNVELAAIFIEDLYQDYIKISLRSKNDFDVNILAREYFNGGGHKNAAGGRFDQSLKECIDFFKNTITQYPELKCA